MILFPIALSAGNSARLSSFARAFVRGRLAVLSSERALTAILALLAGSVIAEAALVLGRAAAPLLVVGAALGIPGAIAIVRAFRTQFSLIRQKLEDAKSFEFILWTLPIGRTGPLFASHSVHNQPDLICLSKGILGGMLPFGATTGG